MISATPVDAAAILALLALTAYALLGGADFGGGAWDLLASGPRGEGQRAAISRAMGPVWEANHVWLIFLLVLLFTAFPAAFVAVVIALFLPLHLVLLGVILRGASFVFRAHGAHSGPRAPLQRTFGAAFGAASTLTPVLLGAALAAVSSGGIRARPGGMVTAPPLHSWFTPFAIATGLLTLALSSYLAAVYLTLETQGRLREDFRRRALGAGIALLLLAALDLPLMAWDAPRLFSRLWSPTAAPLLIGGFLLALFSLALVYRRRFGLGRVLSALSGIALLWGWGFAQWPYVVYPDFSILASAAPKPALLQILYTLPVGVLLLAPSLYLLFKVFKGRNPAEGRPPRQRPRPRTAR
ncbi:MAG: cytochrome d ubiquinol oxidase subunit II [Thermaerobacter sp.]|nr:cytochrome d ubiquinol oxidase subunit II [Thermaerobacter sp.]